MTPQMRYQVGLAAERSVAANYIGRGHRLVSHRWRGAGGEIDLVLERDGEIVFVEVKASKTFERAAESLGARQIRRLLQSAADYLGRCPKGALTPARFDVALVDGQGHLNLLENALGC